MSNNPSQRNFNALLELVEQAHFEEVDELVKRNRRLRRKLDQLSSEGVIQFDGNGSDDDGDNGSLYSEDDPAQTPSRRGRISHRYATGVYGTDSEDVPKSRANSARMRGSDSKDLLESVLKGPTKKPPKMDLTASMPGGRKAAAGLGNLVPKNVFSSARELVQGSSATATAASGQETGGEECDSSRLGSKGEETQPRPPPVGISKTSSVESVNMQSPSMISRMWTRMSGSSPSHTPKRRANLPFQKKPSMTELAEMDDWRTPCPLFWRIMNHSAFEPFFAVLILFNAISLAAEAQIQGWKVGFENGYHNTFVPAPQLDTWIAIFNWFFGIAFTIELTVKVLALGCRFWMELWNLFDGLLVFFWVVEVYFDTFHSADGEALPVNPSLLRIIRLMKLMRLVRLVRRIQGFDALYLMTTALQGSATILAWSAALLVVLLMMLALFANQILTDYYIKEEEHYSRESRMAVYEYFGTFSRSLLSLFEMTLANWPPVCRLLVENVHEAYLIPALIHKLTIGFAVVGVINGVFMQETFKVASTDDRIMVRQKQMAIKTHEHKMINLFEKADSSGDGCLDYEEFEKVVSDEGISTWLASMELDASDVQTLFNLIDDGDGGITVHELMDGVSRLKGYARSIDLAVAMREQQRQSSLLDEVGVTMKEVRRQLSTLGKLQEKIEKETMATAMATAQTAHLQRRTMSHNAIQEALGPHNLMERRSSSGHQVEDRTSYHSHHSHNGERHSLTSNGTIPEHSIPEIHFKTIDIDDLAFAPVPEQDEAGGDDNGPVLDAGVLEEAVEEAMAQQQQQQDASAASTNTEAVLEALRQRVHATDSPPQGTTPKVSRSPQPSPRSPYNREHSPYNRGRRGANSRAVTPRGNRPSRFAALRTPSS